MKKSTKLSLLTAFTTFMGMAIYLNGVTDTTLTWDQCKNKYSLQMDNSFLYGGHTGISCSSWNLNKYWYDMGFQYGNWNSGKGFGYENYCDVQKPLGKTLLSVHYMYQNKGQPGFAGQAYDFVSSRINKLEAHCNNDSGAAADYSDERVRLYKEAFAADTYELTGFFAHEAGHKNGSHNGSWGYCDNGSNCDKNYSDKRAFYWHVQILWDFTRYSKERSDFARQMLFYEANYYLLNRFENRVNFIISLDGKEYYYNTGGTSGSVEPSGDNSI